MVKEMIEVCPRNALLISKHEPAEEYMVFVAWVKPLLVTKFN